MFNYATVVSFLAIFAVAPSIHALPSLAHRHQHRDVPAQFQEREYKADEDILEPYKVYHERYQLFHCEQRHGTKFWDSCCHPLLKGEPLDALPDICFQDVPCDSTTTTSHTPKHTHTSKYKPTETSHHHHTPGNVETPPPTTSTPYNTPSPTTTKGSGGGGGGGGGGIDGKWHEGKGTYYYQKGNAGACGEVHSDDDPIVALNIAYYGNTGVKSKYCGQKIELVNPDNGKSVIAIISDVCPTCGNSEYQDLSIGAMKALDPNYLQDGMINIKWRTDGL